jgi:hypothetical protein
MATKAAEPETTEQAEPEKASIKETVVDILTELGIMGDGKSTETTEELASEEPAEEIESPRQQESRMRRTVETALGDLHIHVDSKAEAPPAKAEPEQTPGKKPFLQRIVGLS